MRVLLISTTPSNKGGISNWVRLLSEHIEQNSDCGVQLDRIETKSYKSLKHSIWEKFIVNGFDIFRIKKEVKKRSKAQRPDVIHITATGEWSTFRDLAILKIANKLNIPVVYHTHFGKIPVYKEKGGFRWKMLYKAISRSASIWTIDGNTQRAVQEAFPEKNVLYVPNPVVLSSLPSLCENKEKSVMYLGWLVKTKGIEELLQAWKTVFAKYPAYSLKLIGPYDEGYMNTLKEAYSFDGVKVTGRLEHSDAMQELAKSEIFILPSYTEGFPNVIIESMALGIPTVGTDVGAIADMLDGDCGIVIQPRSVEAIVDALEKLLENEEQRNRLAKNAMEKARKEYAMENVFRLYRELWSACSESR